MLDCNIPFTFVTLDATHSAYVTMEDAARFRAIGHPACRGGGIAL